MPAWLVLILPYIPDIIKLVEGGVTGLIPFIATIRQELQRSDQWTPEQEAAFKNMLANAYNLPEWKTDAEAKAPPVAESPPTGSA